jgi:pimeloyl-ACP methyl ester carboxylesterase
MIDEKINQTLSLPDGRTLGFADYGDPAGKVVFHFSGSGGSRLGHPADLSILTDLGIRFISTDRPGHGLSDPQPDRQLLDWPEDIIQLAAYLNVKIFYVMGWSAGGPHALACAYKLPNHVLAGAIISGLAPPDRPQPYQGLPFPNRMLMLLGRRVPRLVYLLRRMMYPMIMGDPDEAGEKLASFFPPEDRNLIKGTENQELLIADVQEGYRQGWHGPAQDDIIINSPWRFQLQDIEVRIDVWQGKLDKNVPVNQAIYQDGLIPNSRLTVLPDHAHLYLLTHWRDVLEMLVE